MHILIIEDDIEICSVLQEQFEARNFVVSTTNSGTDGSYLARITNFDLIILDNVLPGKSGITICKEIRAREKTMPILMLSVKADVTIKTQLLNAGADDYVAKPFSFDELLARTYALLRRPQLLQSDVLTVDDLKIDIQQLTVKRGDTPITLTPKEFTLLSYFMRNAGVILTRGMILDHVWDRSIDTFSNTIESHIRTLRKKTERHGPRILHTIPGHGYRIGEPEACIARLSKRQSYHSQT